MNEVTVMAAIQHTYQKYEGWSLSATEVLQHLVERLAELTGEEYENIATNCLYKDSAETAEEVIQASPCGCSRRFVCFTHSKERA